MSSKIVILFFKNGSLFLHNLTSHEMYAPTQQTVEVLVAPKMRLYAVATHSYCAEDVRNLSIGKEVDKKAIT